MNIKPILSVLTIAALGLGANAAQAQSCDTQDIIPLGPPITGTGTLCVTPQGMFGRLQSGGLTPGNAYTTWWVYFDDPSLCAIPFECSDADFGGDNPLGVFGRMDSAVPGGSGENMFFGRVRGMVPSAGSQVWLLAIDHGVADSADGRHLSRQLLTPEDPAAGAPHLGNIVDGPLGIPVALAVFVVE